MGENEPIKREISRFRYEKLRSQAEKRDDSRVE